MKLSSRWSIGIGTIFFLSLFLFLKLQIEKNFIFDANNLVIKDLSSELLSCYMESDSTFKKYLSCLQENYVLKEEVNECVPFR